MSIEAMKMALEALESERDKYLEWGDEDGAPEDIYETIASLRQAIERAEKQQIGSAVREAIDEFGPERFAKAHAAPVQEPVNRNALTLDRPMTFGGCPFCGSQSCVAGQCQHTTQPAAIKQDLTPAPAAPVQERNFCERCGKRLGGEGHIHTCTPPTEKPTGQAPCARHCEANAFKIEIRRLEGELARIKAAQPATQWVGLTDQEIRDWWRIENGLEDCQLSKLVDFTLAVRAIEAKLKEKNT